MSNTNPIKTGVEEEFKDTKGVIKIRKSKDRQHNDQKKKDKQRSTKHTHKTKDHVTRTPLKTDKTMVKKPKKWINNDLQNFTQKTKDRVTRTQLKTRLLTPFVLLFSKVS